MGEEDDQWLDKPLASAATTRIYIITAVVLLLAVVLGATQIVPVPVAGVIGGAAVFVQASASWSFAMQRNAWTHPGHEDDPAAGDIDGVADEDATVPRDDQEDPPEPTPPQG